MNKITLSKGERQFNAHSLGIGAFSHIRHLKEHHTDEEIQETMALLKRHQPKLLKWFEEILGEANNA